ncbi:pyochelin biosynthetic protein PchC [Nocardiopsis sp. Huas11]|uniref:alpha/beta fold hydrolase n=1 Tax=Nocardiopsis sp. Huas11 TaxID=2183912 RepID=UPI000EB0FFFC|nr:alpha/beta fold hydrolase [Nocardiopsis sp. Huas11]RKS05958.1 pyochelin biosynthetic protein PchC [Nocardiopsis sp. Huas11]
MNPWLRRLDARPRAGRILLCFPHAGGAASTYRAWPALVPGDVETYAVQYPGRETRVREPLIDTMDALVKEALAAIEPELDRPVTVFGHSMGASVAHEFTLGLTRLRPGLVERLVVSARPGPFAQRTPARPVHERDDAGVRAALVALGGGGQEVLDHPELRELLLPMIRNDFRLIERYRPSAGVLDVDVLAFSGDADPSMRAELIEAWEAATTGRFTGRVLPGGHFYLHEHLPEVVAATTEPVTSDRSTRNRSTRAEENAMPDSDEITAALSVEGLRASIAEVLGVDASEVTPEAGLFELGLDSMRMMQLSVRWQALGLEVPFADLAEKPTVEAWSELLTALAAEQS